MSENVTFETKEGEAQIVYGDMSVQAVKLPKHLQKRLDASKQRFKKTPMKERMERAEENKANIINERKQACRKTIEAAEKARERIANVSEEQLEEFAQKCDM